MSIIYKEIQKDPEAPQFHAYLSFLLRVEFNPNQARSAPLDVNCAFTPNILPNAYPKWADKITNFKVRTEDTYVLGFPKTGTTWLENIVWLLKNNLDYEKFGKLLYIRSNMLETGVITETFLPHITNELFDEFPNQPSPRVIKSHLAVPLLPNEIWIRRPKIVYITRNPKDVLVSFYHNLADIGLKTDVDNFAKLFINELLPFGPFHDHVQSFWQIRKSANIFFLSFEDLKKNTLSVIERLSGYLEQSYSEYQLREFCERTSFENMKIHAQFSEADVAQYPPEMVEIAKIFE